MSSSGRKNPKPMTPSDEKPPAPLSPAPVVVDDFDDIKKHIKVAAPDLYHGERSKLDDWLLQLQLYFEFQKGEIPGVKKTMFASTYMRGRAFKWIKPSLIGYLSEPDKEDNKDIKVWMESWKEFQIEIRRVFGLSNEENVATRVIQHLRQKKSAAEYTATGQKDMG